MLRYQNNQTYGAHWDDLDLNESKEGLGGGSVRVATVMLYLSGEWSHGRSTERSSAKHMNRGFSRVAAGRRRHALPERQVAAARARSGASMQQRA